MAMKPKKKEPTTVMTRENFKGFGIAATRAAKATAKLLIKTSPPGAAARVIAKANATKGAGSKLNAAPRKINKEQAMVASNRYQAQAPKSKKVKITGSVSASYPKEITNMRSFSQNAKTVEIKPKRTKKLPVKASKKINK